MFQTTKLIFQYLLLSAILLSLKAQSTTEPTEEAMSEVAKRICLEKTGYQPIEDNAYFKIVETPEQNNVTLPCAYCGENGDDLPRIWYWRRRELGAKEEEVEMGLDPNLTDNRIYQMPDNSMTIQLVTVNDTGLYFCRSPSAEEGVSQFHFSLDIVQPEVAVHGKDRREADDDREFVEYNEKTITRANEKLEKDPRLTKELEKVVVKIVSEWDPWLPCDGCLGIRKKYAKCRIRTMINAAKSSDDLTDWQKLLLDSSVISCHSSFIARRFPELYSYTRSLANYLRVQPCQDACIQEQRMLHRAKYKLDFRLDERSSIYFICPGADLKTKVTWRKDGSAVKRVGSPDQLESKRTKWFGINRFKVFDKKEKYDLKHVFVDRMNVLQLCYVGPRESGLYTCYIDNTPVKEINITVVTPSETVRERQYHFLLLSFYTSALSGAIIVLGATWAVCMKRSMFLSASPRESETSLRTSSVDGKERQKLITSDTK